MGTSRTQVDPNHDGTLTYWLSEGELGFYLLSPISTIFPIHENLSLHECDTSLSLPGHTSRGISMHYYQTNTPSPVKIYCHDTCSLREVELFVGAHSFTSSLTSHSHPIPLQIFSNDTSNIQYIYPTSTFSSLNPKIQKSNRKSNKIQTNKHLQPHPPISSYHHPLT